MLETDSGFCIASVGDCFPTSEEYSNAEKYCRAFNQAVAELVAERGLPEWAPGKRLPDRQKVLEMLAGNLRGRKDIPESVRLRHRVNQLVNWKWNGNGDPHAWADFPELNLTMLVGNVSARCGLVEIYDSTKRPGICLAQYQYRRRHFPRLPWDDIGEQTLK
jgi:hypothetical protein